jgi:hypothetical protein
MSTLAELETTIAGLFICLLSAIGPDAAERAIDMLGALVEDSRTGAYEKQFYADLFDSIEMTAPPETWDVFEQLATLH